MKRTLFHPYVLAPIVAFIIAMLPYCDSKVTQSTVEIERTEHGLNESNWPFTKDQMQSNELANDLLATNIYVVFDGSGSMSSSGCSGNMVKIDAAKKALEAFARSVPANANLGLLAFDGKGVLERTSLSNKNRSDFLREINNVYPAGGTPLKTAISIAYEKLTSQAQKQLGYGDYHLVVVTDGQASDNEQPTTTVNTILRSSPIILQTIGFCIDKNHPLNQPGETLYKTADNFESLKQGLESVLAEAPEFAISDFK